MSDEAIARALGLSDKTVAKGIDAIRPTGASGLGEERMNDQVGCGRSIPTLEDPIW